MDERGGENEDAALSIRNGAGVRMNPAVGTLVRDAAVCCGLAPAGADELATACRALLGVITESDERFELSVFLRSRAVAVRIEDRGLPYELSDVEERLDDVDLHGIPGAEFHSYVHRLVDELHFEARGREGNRIELVKRLEPARAAPKRSAGAPDDDRPVSLREMTPDDAVAFTRDVYRSYGYTYASDWAYNPEEIAERIASGNLYGWVCESDGEVVGHFGIHRSSPQSRIAEAGLVMIDSRFRGRHLGTDLGVEMAKWAWEAEMLGIYGEATTAHPFSQRPVITAGGHELCLMLGYIPAGVLYEGVEPTGRRIAAIITFNRLRDLPDLPVYAPDRHAEMIGRIFELNQLGGAPAPSGGAKPAGKSRFSVYTRPDHDFASVDVHKAGDDLAAEVAKRLRRFRRAGIEVVQADLPLSHATTPSACTALEELGFSFAGVAPVDDEAGFRLRLQHLPDVEVVRDDITVVSEFAEELVDYVISERPGD